MHWKGLRIGASNNHDPNGHSVIEPRQSEQLPRPPLSTTGVSSRRSESSPYPLLPTTPDENIQAAGPTKYKVNDSTMENPVACLPLGGTSSSRSNRFSFMKPRHASDPQLSKSYAKRGQDAPPVPSIPPPPTIITTAPTSQEVDQPVKRKNRFSVLPKPNNPMEGALARMNIRHDAENSMDSMNVGPGPIGEKPGRLSTNSLHSGGREHPSDSHRSSVADVRFSESSRSDQGQGDRGTHRTDSPRDGATTGSKRFHMPHMPRLKRNRGPLFPLPPKVPTPEPGDSRPPNWLASRSDIADNRGHDHVSPLPSPTRSSVRLSQGPGLVSRRDSVASARSANSNSSNQVRDAPRHRGRSSTMDSIPEPNERSSPHFASSGRTSTSTSGRKSFGDIFNFSNRFRQDSEPPLPHNGSPGVTGAGTPASKPPSLRPASYPPREESDTPAEYLRRLEESVPKGSIAGILALSDDEFYKTALRKFMRGFAFFGDPIDMSIRKLLMEVELPKETQQIDRFLQSFAGRYHECNPGIFASADQAHFIAFSILILHTDVFNKNNKRKMQKQDYVKNTRGEGIADDILGCIYENICYTPFIHIEGANAHARHLTRPKRGLFKSVSSENLSLAAKEPVDPYALILEGKLDSLRPSLTGVMNLDDTYSCTGSSGPPDMDSLHETFAKSGILQIVSARSRPDAFMRASINNPADSHPGLVDIKVAKVGLLWRKDPKKKKTRSPWREWGVLLTFSQLYFFRDVNWVKSLISQHKSRQKDGRRRTVVFTPPLTDFKPDGIMSTDDAVALLDSGYKRHKHAFLFVRHNSLEEVFLASSEADMNDWLAALNYAAAFRTTGVRTKGMIAPNYEGQRYRVSRVASNSSVPPADKEPLSPTTETDVAEEFVMARRDLMCQRVREANEKLSVSHTQLENFLRNARHLQTMTPVQVKTREQVITAAGRISAQIKWARQDIWRTKCYKDVLMRDLGEEAKTVAEKELPSTGPNTATSELGQTSTADQPPNGVPRQMAPDTSDNADNAPVSQAPGPRRPSAPASTASSEPIRSGRLLSADNAKERAESVPPSSAASGLEREPSILSTGSRMDVSSLGSGGSKFLTSASIDDGEERILREAGLLEISTSPQGRIHAGDSEQKNDESHPLSQKERTRRVRRSLQRSLRDSRREPNGEHSRGKRARDSMPGAPAEDEGKNEGEGLSRKNPSFTFHGKKASVVTFGTEWETMAPEERLKLRKPTPSASDLDTAAGSATLKPMSSEPSNGHPQAQWSASTGTRESFRQEESKDVQGAFGEMKTDSTAGDNVADQNSAHSDPDATSPTSSQAPTWNGQLAVPSDDGVASGAASSGDETVENNQEKIQHKPSEQTVSA